MVILPSQSLKEALVRRGLTKMKIWRKGMAFYKHSLKLKVPKVDGYRGQEIWIMSDEYPTQKFNCLLETDTSFLIPIFYTLILLTMIFKHFVL